MGITLCKEKNYCDGGPYIEANLDLKVEALCTGHTRIYTLSFGGPRWSRSASL
jgi:hypothetical protein